MTCVDVSLFLCAIFADTRYRSVLVAPSVLHSSHNFPTYFIQNLITLCSFYKYHSLISVFQFFHSFTVSLNTATTTMHIIVTDLCSQLLQCFTALTTSILISYRPWILSAASTNIIRSFLLAILSQFLSIWLQRLCTLSSQICVRISSSASQPHRTCHILITLCNFHKYHSVISVINSFTVFLNTATTTLHIISTDLCSHLLISSSHSGLLYTLRTPSTGLCWQLLQCLSDSLLVSSRPSLHIDTIHRSVLATPSVHLRFSTHLMHVIINVCRL